VLRAVFEMNRRVFIAAVNHRRPCPRLLRLSECLSVRVAGLCACLSAGVIECFDEFFCV